MATQGKEDVFQNVKFTSVKPNTRKASDVEFQDSENDSTMNIQDNGHTKSKFQKVLQRKGIWIGLTALLIITLMSATMIGVVYSQLDSRIAEMKSKYTKQQALIDAQKIEIDYQKLENDQQQQQINDQSSMINKFQTCTSPRVVFTAVVEKGFSMRNGFPGSKLTVADSHSVIFDKDIINEGSDYRNTTGEFVCSTPGIYSFSVNALSYYKKPLCLELQHNSNIVSSLQAHDPDSIAAASTTAVMHLSAGDVVRVWTTCTSEFARHSPYSTRSNTFSGVLIQADDCRMTDDYEYYNQIDSDAWARGDASQKITLFVVQPTLENGHNPRLLFYIFKKKQLEKTVYK